MGEDVKYNNKSKIAKEKVKKSVDQNQQNT